MQLVSENKENSEMNANDILVPSRLVHLVLAGAMLMLASCTYLPPAPPPAAGAGQPAGLTGVLNGTVTYRERIALARDAVVEVTLQEVSRADAPATIIASQTIEPQGAQVPLAFTLTYDPAQIKPMDIWAVRATIKEGGELTWTSTRRYPVITQDAPADNVEIVVERVARSQVQPSAAPAASGVLSGTVTYQPRIALPPDTVLDVTLLDITDADTPARVVAAQTAMTDGEQVPLPFELAYDPAEIDPARTYRVAAHLISGGIIRWIPGDTYLVLTQGAPQTGIEIMMTPAPESEGMAGPEGVISGVVTYLNRSALPPVAVIEVQLQDVTIADAPSTVLASQRQVAGGRQVPIPFELAYNPNQIQEGRIYALSVRITIDGALRYINTTLQRVLNDGAPATDIEVVVQPV